MKKNCSTNRLKGWVLFFFIKGKIKLGNKKTSQYLEETK